MAFLDRVLFVCLCLSVIKTSLGSTFDVISYGASGHGRTDDTQAFLKAWEKTCSTNGNPTLKINSGTFFLNPLVFEGPCRSPTIQVQIDGNLIAPSSKGAWKHCQSNTWIVFRSVNGLKIYGTGTLDSKGSAWWHGNGDYDQDDSVSEISNGGTCNKPTTFRLVNCNSAQITGLHFLNSGGNHISIDNSQSVVIHNINIQAPKESPNTDGINLFYSKHVQITNSFIGTGDDCIAISNQCFNVNISHIRCGPGHGISVGSLGKDGSRVAVEGIYVQHCTFKGTLAAARIKTWQGGRGYARNIHYDHINVDSVTTAIEINQHYTNQLAKSTAVQLSKIHFTNVQGTARKIVLECSQNARCKEVVVHQINVTSSSPRENVEVSCENADVDKSGVIPNLPC